MLCGEIRALANATSISSSFTQEVDGVAWRRLLVVVQAEAESTGSPSGPRHPVHIFTSDLNSGLRHVWTAFFF